MAVVHRKSSLKEACVIFILASVVGHSWGLVHELSKKNIEKFLQGKLLTLTFLDSPSCDMCRILFPFFVAASQVFPHDPEIFFTRTSDENLIKEFGITVLPAIIYHRTGMKRQEQMKVDITVDNIIDEIARILHGNFGRLTRTYGVHVNDKNFVELIVSPNQAVMMLVHDRDDDRERDVIEKLAYTFRNDDAVLFADLDIVTHKKLRDDVIKTLETPIVMWYSADDKKSPGRFGGILSHELLTQFVNERTGLHRNVKGELTKKAGLVKKAAEIVNKNVIHIMEGNTEDMKPVLSDITDLLETVPRHQVQMVEYYLFVLENIVANGPEKPVKTILKELETRLTDKDVTDLSTKQVETARRKGNIVESFLLLEEKYFEERKAKSQEEIQMEINLKESKKKKDTTEPLYHHDRVEL